MKTRAWLAAGMVGQGAGLGKMDILFVPHEIELCLVVFITTDGRAWMDDDTYCHPNPEKNPVTEVEIPNSLADEIIISFGIKRGEFGSDTEERIRELVQKIKLEEKNDS